MSETSLLRRVMLAASHEGVRVFRNNIGTHQDAHGNWIRYGIAHPGGSDLIGWTTVNGVAVFTAIEVKSPTGHTDRQRAINQQAFIDAVLRAGGIAGIVRSEDDVRRLLRIGQR